MTDKVQKIREEVVRMHNLLPVVDGDNISLNYADRICTTLEMYIDSLQEEPVSGNIDFEQELYKTFGQVRDFTLGVQIAKLFYGMGKNSKEHVSEDKLEGLRNAFRLALDDEEPISDDLEEAAYHNCIDRLSKESIEDFKAGAKWQAERFEKNRLKHCNNITNEQAELEQGFIDQHLDKNNRIPTFLDAIEYGASWKKEQMMKDAIDATVYVDAGGYPCIPQIELYNYIKDVPLAKYGDKYKVVLIKENKDE